MLFVILIVSLVSGLIPHHNAQSKPRTIDPNLKVETLVDGLENPTSMAFLGPNDMLVLEKNNGQVRRVLNEMLLPEPLIDLNVANAWERGLLGIAVTNTREPDLIESSNNSYHFDLDNTSETERHVFLYFTKGGLMSGDGGDQCPRANMCQNENRLYGNSVTNYLYRYEFKNETLVNPKPLLKTGGGPGADHNGGAIMADGDNNVYITVGDGDSCEAGTCLENFKVSVLNSLRSNFNNGTEPDGRGGILRITQDGQTVLSVSDSGGEQRGGFGELETGILGNSHPLNKYYAYGIRNSFGMDLDPVTGKLWDTENGPGFGDEINLVEPGFNSGWARMQGIWTVSDYTATPPIKGFFSTDSNDNNTGLNNMVDFGGKGKYSPPEFVWNITVAPTALKFYDSNILGEVYENDIFVAGYANGEIYHFDLNRNRTSLELHGELKDRIANSSDELEDIRFAEGFGIGGKGGITDIEIGPHDGYLYLVSHAEGKLYRISPTNNG